MGHWLPLILSYITSMAATDATLDDDGDDEHNQFTTPRGGVFTPHSKKFQKFATSKNEKVYIPDFLGIICAMVMKTIGTIAAKLLIT